MYTNKKIIITGTSRGVGFKIANYFLKNNAIIIGLSRSESKISDSNYHHISLDISSQEEIFKAFKAISRRFRTIDILINNAAVMTSQYSMIMPAKNATDMVNTNLLGVFFVSREAAKLMRHNSMGRIINIGSMASVLEPQGDSIYAATKMAVITLSNVMAKELSSMNITCNTVAISAIETDMLKQHSDIARNKIEEIIQSLPIPRMAKIDDILNVIDFYCSERSSYITGQTIYLGGLH